MFNLSNLHKSTILKKNNFFFCYADLGFYFFKFLVLNYKYYNKIKFCKISYSIYVYYFKKFFYTGKSYKIYKQKKKLYLIFNRSHITFLYFKNFITFNFKTKSKTKFKFKFLYKRDIGYFVGFLKKIRKFNVFTKRGIKINKIPFFKKKGKVSQYRLVI